MSQILHEAVKSHCYLLEKAIDENALAKILGNPFDDNEVLGLARNVVLAIKDLPAESQQRFDEQKAYAFYIIESFRPAPRSSYTTSAQNTKTFVRDLTFG